MTSVYLTLNAGSSNLKYSVYDAHKQTLLTQGKLEYHASDAQQSLALSIDRTVAQVENQFGSDSIAAVGHRVVHGGDEFYESTLVRPEVVAALRQLIPLAPLHLPAELDAIDIMAAHFPALPQVICFDTAFHRTQMPLARWFALTRDLHNQGIKRYGFHGLSYHYISTQLDRLLQPAHREKVIVAHLGNGASMCAMAQGCSVTTTMGFTALDGLMMGTRCGELDVGVVLHLCQQRGMSLAEVEKLLYKQSGLLGVSGISGDVRKLEASTAPEAREACELFALRAAQKLASLIPPLQGVDAVVFTGGIGEHSAIIRARIVDHLHWLGARLDHHANAEDSVRLHAADSALGLYVIPTNEELMIATQTAALVPV